MRHLPDNAPNRAAKPHADAVDELLAQWHAVRPDVDVSPMGVIGRISRAAAVLDRRLAAAFAPHGIAPGEFDVLATLLRAGEPHELTVSRLLSSAMVTSGAMTHRLNRLEAAGLIERRIDPADRRGVIVTLTAKGKGLADRALADHLVNEQALLADLAPAERAQLASLLRALLISLGDTP